MEVKRNLPCWQPSLQSLARVLTNRQKSITTSPNQIRQISSFKTTSGQEIENKLPNMEGDENEIQSLDQNASTCGRGPDFELLKDAWKRHVERAPSDARREKKRAFSLLQSVKRAWDRHRGSKSPAPTLREASVDASKWKVIAVCNREEVVFSANHHFPDEKESIIALNKHFQKCIEIAFSEPSQPMADPLDKFSLFTNFDGEIETTVIEDLSKVDFETIQGPLDTLLREELSSTGCLEVEDPSLQLSGAAGCHCCSQCRPKS